MTSLPLLQLVGLGFDPRIENMQHCLSAQQQFNVLMQQQNAHSQFFSGLANANRTPQQQKLDRAKAIAAEVRERRGMKVCRYQDVVAVTALQAD